MNQRIVNKINTLAVNAYKTLGSVLLALILLGLVSYLGVQTFFFVGHAWLTPTVVSPTDPQILQLNTQLAQQAAARDKLLADRRDMETRLEQAQRLLGTEKDFQERFRLALGSEREARAKALRRLAMLRQEYQQAAQEISESNRAYAGMARTRTEALYKARMLEREDRLTANHQLAQMAQSNLSLAEGSAELQTRLEALKRELDGFDASLGGKARGLTTEVLLLEREYTRSVLEVARAESERTHLEESLRSLDEAVARYDTLLATIRGSPWMEAIERGVTVGFVPYENLENAAPGTPLYRCALTLLWCREVGMVGHALQGEVTVKHPVRQTMLRGVMVELELRDEHWAREQLLHLGRPPLLL
ncbi:hypothetical protein [Vitiosangium sp. GDMCC 1.1324]|uniref:hypothetical protein n=1 Tax=Vitiosangium sp. (strain GDMCC 1.1324) TaxID=2138576 RepID=UPI000D3D878B|nr:hypothetical protein [Vitiosangium sp. GDMCC 1.1324]PTL76928.1 hypothetical protein DAT35_47555 [Vitiosangium sp. GDMCC 1.1324]